MSRPLDPRLLRSVPAVRRLVITLTAVNACASALMVAQVLVLARLIVTVFSRHPDADSVVGRLLLFAVLGCARAATAGMQEYFGARASLHARTQLRELTLRAIVRLGPVEARRRAPGTLVTAVGPGLDALDGYVTRALPALVSASIVPVAALVAITWTDRQSGVILIVLLPLVPVFMALVGLTTTRLVARQHAVLDRLSGQFLDLLRGLRTLQIYGRAQAQERNLRLITHEYGRRTVAALRIALLSGLILDLIAALSVAVVAVDIGLRLDAGHVTFMTALVVLLLAPELFAPLRAVGAQHHASQDGTAAAAAALDLVDAAPPAEQLSHAPACGVTTGRVGIRKLTVRYPQRAEPAVDGVTIDLEPNTVVALTGPSGSGKSSVLAALLALVPAADGEVRVSTVDGHPTLAELDQVDWRAQTAWLPQRPRPTQPTVADEVRLGDPTADDRAVAAACRDCAAPAPATKLAEDGVGVSAGQRRRIALARVLLRARAVRAAGGVPLVLLDEPSEDLDRATEAVVAQVILELRAWSTVVVATHSGALADLADVHAVLDSGRLTSLVCSPPRIPAPMSGAPASDPLIRPSFGAGARWSVRRFVAVDMYGTAGTLRRRRIVTAEFVLGTAGLVALAAILFGHRGRLWAIWALGCAVNYAALAVHALALYRRGRLESALEGVDVRAEIRRYSIAQLLLFIPTLVAIIAIIQAPHRNRPAIK